MLAARRGRLRCHQRRNLLLATLCAHSSAAPMELASVRMTDAAESTTGTGAACATAERAPWALSRSRYVQQARACRSPPPPHTHTQAHAMTRAAARCAGASSRARGDVAGGSGWEQRRARATKQTVSAGEWTPCNGWELACRHVLHLAPRGGRAGTRPLRWWTLTSTRTDEARRTTSPRPLDARPCAPLASRPETR